MILLFQVWVYVGRQIDPLSALAPALRTRKKLLDLFGIKSFEVFADGKMFSVGLYRLWIKKG